MEADNVSLLPAAKPKGHRTESVVLLVVVGVVGVTLSPARMSYPSTPKNDCVGYSEDLPDIPLFFFYIMATLFPTQSFFSVLQGFRSHAIN